MKFCGVLRWLTSLTLFGKGVLFSSICFMHLESMPKKENKNLHDFLLALLILSLTFHILFIPLMGTSTSKFGFMYHSKIYSAILLLVLYTIIQMTIFIDFMIEKYHINLWDDILAQGQIYYFLTFVSGISSYIGVLIIIFALYSFRDKNLYPDNDGETDFVDIENEIAMTAHPINKKDREKLFAKPKNRRIVYLKERKKSNSNFNNNNDYSSSDSSNDDNNLQDSSEEYSEKVFVIAKKKSSKRKNSEKNNQNKIHTMNNENNNTPLDASPIYEKVKYPDLFSASAPPLAFGTPVAPGMANAAVNRKKKKPIQNSSDDDKTN